MAAGAQPSHPSSRQQKKERWRVGRAHLPTESVAFKEYPWNPTQHFLVLLTKELGNNRSWQMTDIFVQVSSSDSASLLKKKNQSNNWLSPKKIYKWQVKHMKKCSISHVIRNMQIKTSMRYHYTPMRTAKIQDTDITKCWGVCGINNRNCHSLLVGMRNGTATW